MHRITPSPRLRVGAAAILAFLVLLLAGALRGPAAAGSAAPAAVPATPSNVQPLEPRERDPGFHRGPGPRGFGDDDDDRGGGDDDDDDDDDVPAPAPSAGGDET